MRVSSRSCAEEGNLLKSQMWLFSFKKKINIEALSIESVAELNFCNGIFIYNNKYE